MQVELPAELLKEVASAAILNALTPEKRETIIKQAVSHLLSPGSHMRDSPITQAFNDGIRYAAIQVAKEMFEKNETLKAKIKQLLEDAIERVMVTNREKTIER